MQTTTLNIVESHQGWPIIEKICENCTLKINEEENELKIKIEQLERKIEDLSKPKCSTCGKHKKV